MELYSVILADDEEQIRAGISRKINWEELGFKLIGEAENGAEALELCEQLRPDVLLTDIKMPFMDGLELCKKLKQSLPTAKMIVFSGFDDFEYARRAVSSGVFEYIMKPINANELGDVLTRLREKLDTERLEKRDMEALRHQYEESLPVLRELFYTRLLDGHIPNDEINQRALRFDIDISKGKWTTVLVRVNAQKALSYDELVLLSIRSFIEQHFQLDVSSFRTLIYNDMVTLLVQTEHIYPLIQEMQRLCYLVSSYLGINICVGIGRIYTAENLKFSAKEAQNALDTQILTGDTQVLYIGDIEPKQTARLSFDEQDMQALENAIKFGTQNDVSLFIETLMNRVRETRFTLAQCHLFFLEIITALVRIARSVGEDVEENFCKNFTNFVSISDFNSLNDLGDWLCSHCTNLQELLGQKRSDSASKTISKAKDFISCHFTESDISVDTLCDYLHLSSAYFSTLFKRETGKSFIAYVTELRMEMAANMLTQTDEKTYLIAEKIGYTDPNYFSYVFKKHFGLTPSKYRAGKRS